MSIGKAVLVIFFVSASSAYAQSPKHNARYNKLVEQMLKETKDPKKIGENKRIEQIMKEEKAKKARKEKQEAALLPNKKTTVEICKDGTDKCQTLRAEINGTYLLKVFRRGGGVIIFKDCELDYSDQYDESLEWQGEDYRNPDKPRGTAYCTDNLGREWEVIDLE